MHGCSLSSLVKDNLVEISEVYRYYGYDLLWLGVVVHITSSQMDIIEPRNDSINKKTMEYKITYF